MIEFETYKTAVLSTAHLRKMDRKILERTGSNMVVVHDTGFFLKLYADCLDSNLRDVYSQALKKIITICWSQGYQCIEFDCDAPKYDSLKTFDW